MSDPSTAETPPSPSGCQYTCERSVACVTLQPTLSDVKWDQIEAIGNSVESRIKDDKPTKVVFDVEGLTYMGSAMVALIVRWWKAVDSTGGKSAVACHDANVLEVFKLASLDEHWMIVPTRDAAFKKLGASPVVSAPVSTSNQGERSTASTPASDASSDAGPMWPGLVAAAAVVLGAVNLIFSMSGESGFGFQAGASLAVLGTVAGLIGVFISQGKGRALSTLFLAGSIAVGVTTFAFLNPTQATPADQTGGEQASSEEDAEVSESESPQPEEQTGGDE